MSDSAPPSSDWFRPVLIAVLLFIAYQLTEYAPLIPKTIRFMDDVHKLNAQAPEYQQTAVELKTTAKAIMEKITAIESRFNFFRQEAERRGMKWENQ